MTKVFNVDSLYEKEPLEIILNGKNHVVHEMNVASFLETMKDAEKLKDSKDDTTAQIEVLIAGILRAIPTVTDAEIRALTFDKLNAVSQFIRGEVPDELREAVGLEPTEEQQAKN